GEREALRLAVAGQRQAGEIGRVDRPGGDAVGISRNDAAVIEAAPLATPAMVTERTASGSTLVSSASAALMLSAICVSSLPLAVPVTVSMGGSATGLTVMSTVACGPGGTDVLLPSIDVTVTFIVSEPGLSSLGV